MEPWTRVREGIERFVTWTKLDPVLSPAAKVALRSIPVIGPFLSDVYDEMGTGTEEEEDGRDLILEILARIDAIGPTGFEDVKATLHASHEEQQGARAALEDARRRLRDLAKDVEATRSDLSAMISALDRMESELTGLAWGLTDFDPNSRGDVVSLFTLLGTLLNRSRTIFLEQDRIATSIERSLDAGEAPPPELHGRDDVLWWASRHGRIPDTGAARRQFRELRRVTDRMRDVNLRVRSLVRRNRALLASDIDVDALDTHLSTWLAKYDYLRDRYDDHMCMVFVGVPPTDVPFPPRTDAAIERRLEFAMQGAKLGHVVVRHARRSDS